MSFRREQEISLDSIVESTKENQLRITKRKKYNYLSNPFICLMDADLGRLKIFNQICLIHVLFKEHVWITEKINKNRSLYWLTGSIGLNTSI